MRAPATALLLAAYLASPALAEPAPTPGSNVSSLGRKMPPPTGRAPGGEAAPGAAGPALPPEGPAGRSADTGSAEDRAKEEKTRATKAAEAKQRAAVEAEMVKAQAAAEARNKAWDSRMRKTMGSICKGC